MKDGRYRFDIREKFLPVRKFSRGAVDAQGGAGQCGVLVMFSALERPWEMCPVPEVGKISFTGGWEPPRGLSATFRASFSQTQRQWEEFL